MKIKFSGAVQEVTGSNYLVECGKQKFFVDCGIHQGQDEDARNKTGLPVNPSEIAAVLLTHAHMDHSGRVPYLVKNGFRGKIWATPPTTELLPVLWRDSAHLMMEEAAWKNRKNARKGLPLIEPLYDLRDVEAAIKLLSPVGYEEQAEVLPGVELFCHNAGHILGSASLFLTLRDEGREAGVVFSGDLGQAQSVMERTPSAFRRAHYALIESTYGERRHKSLSETRDEFRSVVLQALRDKGKVLIPSFVIDRAQRILYELLLMQRDGLLPELPIFFDSPMGVKATELYRRHGDTLSDDIQRIMADGQDPFAPMGLTYVASPEDSRRINDVPFGIVIAGSGMCSGGRIVHHLKHGLWNPKNHVIFVGYQGYGTLGRRIIDGASKLRIAGEEVAVAARIHTIGGFSAHGDCDDLLAWAKNFETNPLFFVTHGERSASHALAFALQQAGMRSMVPLREQEFQLLAENVLRAAAPETVRAATDDKGGRSGAAAALDALLPLIERLRSDVKHSPDSPAMEKAMETVMPLLLSARTLLETARKITPGARD